MYRVVNGELTPVVFQIVIWDGEKLFRARGCVSKTSITDGQRDWYIYDGAKIVYIRYVNVAAWASLGA